VEEDKELVVKKWWRSEKDRRTIRWTADWLHIPCKWLKKSTQRRIYAAL